jgi:hypothetical protein
MRPSIRKYPCDICSKLFYSNFEVKSIKKLLDWGCYHIFSFILFYDCFEENSRLMMHVPVPVLYHSMNKVKKTNSTATHVALHAVVANCTNADQCFEIPLGSFRVSSDVFQLSLHHQSAHLHLRATCEHCQKKINFKSLRAHLKTHGTTR